MMKKILKSIVRSFLAVVLIRIAISLYNREFVLDLEQEIIKWVIFFAIDYGVRHLRSESEKEKKVNT